MGRGVRRGWAFPTLCLGSHLLGGKGIVFFEWLPFLFLDTHLTLILAAGVDYTHFTDGEGPGQQLLSSGPKLVRVKGPPSRFDSEAHASDPPRPPAHRGAH